MKRIEIEQVFDVPLEEFEYAFACEDMERIIEQVHEVDKRETLEWTDDGKGFHRRFRYHASSRVPKVLEKFIGGLTASVQTMDYSRRTRRGSYSIHSEALGKRLTYRSEFSVEPRGPGQVARKSVIEIDLRLPLVGQRVVNHLAEEVKAREHLETKAIADFLRETWPRIRDRVIERWPGGSALDELEQKEASNG